MMICFYSGYSMPHPSEPYVHVRLQTDGNKTAAEMLRHGLSELSACCDHIDAAFSDAFDDFEKGME
jgi:DNA-directed RNA polymerase I and III subunit RPAC2